jgi:tetratricopeptide (TPR) repeat protein
MSSTLRSLRWLLTLALVAAAHSFAAKPVCSKATAADIYDRAQHAFEANRYDDAIDLLRKANACQPNPVYLANIARAHEEAHRPKEAISAWREYLGVVSTEGERRLAEGRISTLSKLAADLDRLEGERRAAEAARIKAEELARASAAAAKTEQSAPPPPPPRKTFSPGGWVTFAAGAAGLIAGGALGFVASQRHNSAAASASGLDSEALQIDAYNLAHAANWSLAIGGAAALAGIIWLIVELARS